MKRKNRVEIYTKICSLMISRCENATFRFKWCALYELLIAIMLRHMLETRVLDEKSLDYVIITYANYTWMINACHYKALKHGWEHKKYDVYGICCRFSRFYKYIFYECFLALATLNFNLKNVITCNVYMYYKHIYYIQ